MRPCERIETQGDVVLLFGQSKQGHALGIGQVLHILGQGLLAQRCPCAAAPPPVPGEIAPLRSPTAGSCPTATVDRASVRATGQLLPGPRSHRCTSCSSGSRSGVAAAALVLAACAQILTGQFQRIDHVMFDPGQTRSRSAHECRRAVARAGPSSPGCPGDCSPCP